MLLLMVFAAASAGARDASAQQSAWEQTMQPMTTVRGPFEPTIKPTAPDAWADGAVMGRNTLDKVYHGPLEAVAVGQMLHAMGTVKGSAAYSAIERVTGALDGRRGSFMLQHTGVMTRGAQSLLLTVVPDSGTDELAGLDGSMQIEIEGKAHRYVFAYRLP
jgi:hypothetical protein